jgi:hypothetical protein
MWLISGLMIEWLKKLYDRIRYLVRLDGRFAPAFRSFLGILTGDPGSPHLWNLFMSDLILTWHSEDIKLNERKSSDSNTTVLTPNTPGIRRELHQCALFHQFIQYSQALSLLPPLPRKLREIFIDTASKFLT